MVHIPSKSPQATKVKVKVKVQLHLLIQCDEIRSEQSGAEGKELM